ncbi:hypothetical protein HMPREF0220_0630 [Clostridioides difficile NAP08]|uniref:Uncharacterized protein n=1 Tax=Clostridioides difficile NAP08 TaxID=525259 RepID=D5Q148_CLODI|nr:hypothetical protein HMPREF0220_0630 [Clostridioides difficile NAP08]EFH16656.1 hypothetical protein HMPREF0219_0609 [Clostridioides difficile NAP07]
MFVLFKHTYNMLDFFKMMKYTNGCWMYKNHIILEKVSEK